MLLPAKQNASVVELKIAETVRKDRAIAEAAAKMNAALSRSLLVSRMLTAFAVTASLLVIYVVRYQGKTIDSQQQLIRQFQQDNQQLLQYRLTHPPTAAQQQPQQEQQPDQPAQPSDQDGTAPVTNPATQIHMADGCLGGVCA